MTATHAAVDIDSEDSSDIADCSIDYFSDDSIISELDDVDQQIFASARKGKLTLEEVIRLLSSRKRANK
jgi:formylmethanofuran dehydrogenase subunit E-like metal-binding protein